MTHRLLFFTPIPSTPVEDDSGIRDYTTSLRPGSFSSKVLPNPSLLGESARRKSRGVSGGDGPSVGNDQGDVIEGGNTGGVGC